MPGCRRLFYFLAYEGHKTPRGNCNYYPRPHFLYDPWSLYDWTVWKHCIGLYIFIAICEKVTSIKTFPVESYLSLSCFPLFSGCLGSGQGEGSVSAMCSSDSELGRTSCSLYWWGVTGALHSQRLVGQWSGQLTCVNSKHKHFEEHSNYLWVFQEPSFWGGPGPWSKVMSPWPMLRLLRILWLLITR